MCLLNNYLHHQELTEEIKSSLEQAGYYMAEVMVGNRCHFNTVISELKTNKAPFKLYRLPKNAGLVIATLDGDFAAKLESHKKLCGA